jgi:hypothetical protein
MLVQTIEFGNDWIGYHPSFYSPEKPPRPNVVTTMRMKILSLLQKRSTPQKQQQHPSLPCVALANGFLFFFYFFLSLSLLFRSDMSHFNAGLCLDRD